MSTCCTHRFRCAADAHFDRTIAERDLKSYREKGPGVTTRLLRDLIVAAGQAHGVVLDVGCGVGPLTFELLDHGIDQAVCVDASSAHLAAASGEAARRARTNAVRFVEGDFVDVAAAIPAAGVVTLDRVVCCYPSYEPLLEQSMRHAERCLALSYPRDVWYMHVAFGLENLIRYLRGRSFRAFVHPVARIVRLIEQAGFERAAHRKTWQWSIDVYVRRS
jgi:magnesium-protoporphyrin O-methyltransferase